MKGKYGNGRVYQRGERWWIQYYKNGERYQEPGGKTEREAKSKLRTRLA